MTATENKKPKAVTRICTLDELTFPVELRDNPRNTNPEYSKVVVGVIDGKEFDLNYCSNIYGLVPNEDIFPVIETILNNHNISFDVTYKHINHVRFYADYVITDKRYTYFMNGTNDGVQPMLRVQHSYNGLTKYHIVFGYFRLVCSNGLVIAVEEMKDYNLSIVGKHTTQILHSFDVLNELLLNFSQNAQQVTQAIVSKYELLGGRFVSNVQDRIKEVLTVNKIAVVENSKFNTLNDIMGRISNEMAKPELAGLNGRINDWMIYNGINQYLNSDRTIAAPEKRNEMDSKVFEYMLEHAS